MGSFVMSWVIEGHEIESETGVYIDMWSFVMSWVTEGREIEGEGGLTVGLVRKRQRKDQQW